MLPVLALYGFMLIIMLLRVGVPIGVRVQGQVLGDVPLTFRERVRLQRTNVYLIGGALLLGAVAGWLNLLIQLIVIGAVLAILTIPTHYIITSEGLALNQVVFRRWGEFASVAPDRSGLRLHGRDGCRDFAIVVGEARQAEVRQLIERALHGEAPQRTRRTKAAKGRRATAS